MLCISRGKPPRGRLPRLISPKLLPNSCRVHITLSHDYRTTLPKLYGSVPDREREARNKHLLRGAISYLGADDQHFKRFGPVEEER